MSALVLPKFNTKLVENLFHKDVLSNEELKEILAIEGESLAEDLEKVILFCAENGDFLFDNEYSNNTLIYALFLLKEINAKNKIELILKVLDIDDEWIDYWFGDFFTEYYWALIVHFGKENTKTLIDSLKNIKANTFSNEQIALALFQIYLKYPETQKAIANAWTELLEVYTNFNEHEIDETYFAFFTSYIFNPTDYQISLIKTLYDKGYIDLTVNGDFDELFEIIETEKKDVTIFEIQDDLLKYYNYEKDSLNPPFVFKPITHEPKIQRNDPCPCGSGKKYKKCCLN